MTTSTDDFTCFDDTAVPVSLCPGRIRIQYPHLHRSDKAKRNIEAVLTERPSVFEACANPLTGNILIVFDPAVAVTKMLAELGLRMAPNRKAIPAQPSREQRRRQARMSTPSLQSTVVERTQWQLLPEDEVLARLGSDARRGLHPEVAEQRLRNGLNVLPQKKPTSACVAFLAQFTGLPVLLLGMSAVLSLLTGGLAEAAAIVAVLGLNATIGFVTERRSEATIASLSELVDEQVPVIRDGRQMRVASSHIAPGDLLLLLPGVHIAADARLLQVHSLLVDESALTGESRFVPKSPAQLAGARALAARSNMVHMGTAVAAGRGVAVVTATGVGTELGLVQTLVATTAPPQTPIQRQLDELGNRLVMISTTICVVVFVIGLLRGRGMLEMLKASISLAIAAVPEGLPTVATTSFARGLRVMREKEMLIRRLQAVETLGAIHTICFDKTGTLTLNRMSVVALETLSASYGSENGAALVLIRKDDNDYDRDLAALLDICVLSNESGSTMEDPTSLSNGSATENALICFANDAGVSTLDTRERFPLLHARLRAEGRNYMTTVHAMQDTDRQLVALKGSPMEVLGMCIAMHGDAGLVPLSPSARDLIAQQNAGMAARQLRVLGFAYLERDAADPLAPPGENLIWLGLVGLADPIRPGMEHVIAEFQRAGLRTVMITGDQSATAHAIGQHLGLASQRELHVVDAEHFDNADKSALRKLVLEADVFARVSPARKLQIVQALQESGEVVAMTGDGVNDGPALRAADIGIAMGLQGTNLARSAADVVLQDDRLETVLDAIRQGRTITRNVERSLEFLISSNLSEILLVLGSVIATGTSPLSPMQLLWVNLLSDVLPAIALAAEPPEGDVMRHPPRDARKVLVGKPELMQFGRRGALLTAGSLGAYFYGLVRYGVGPQSSGIAFNSLMLGQLLHALTCRSHRNGSSPQNSAGSSPHMLDYAVSGSIGLQLLANVLPMLRGLLGLRQGIRVADIAVIMAGAGIPFLANSTGKRDEREQTRQ